MSSQDKSPDAFRTISEVAEDLDLPQHVLRFWETRFSQIKPLKRGGGRRYYRPDDVELLKGIRHLLYGEGYTIKGVQRILKEHGPRFAMQIWRENAPGVAGVASTEQPPQAAIASVSPVESQPSVDAVPDQLPTGVLADDAPDLQTQSTSGGLNILSRLRGEKPAVETPASGVAISKDDIRKLQATLFELLECKRTLDRAR
ncbi:MAG: MerR family transcriptional regulator [Roseibium sp.]|uniref:MerR family transcriptional regulator n=1 Tax=Roseibium sp. TaxID=1936156 RepID=UPI001B1ED44E|nr:MerR family transcriptional regulator [Roseibium sp.]MBO6891030.1 MerR family transcriptional regulator [Roseibium sp.]MBO6932665.1 MerR family transcriptional regulator [Roseibium sp.]